MRFLGGRALALVAATCGLVACDAGDDERAAGRVAHDFYAAVAAQDGGVACGLLEESTTMELEKDEMAPCPKAVLKLKLSGSQVSDATVYVTSARIDLRRGDSVFLDETPAGWKVSAAGCKPRSGEEEPYDCEVES